MRRFLLLVFPAIAWAQSQYTITDLGTLPNLDACIATSISPNGKIAGYCHVSGQAVTGATAAQGFLYSGGKLTALLQGAGPQVALGVNDDGTVVGVAAPQSQDFATGLFAGDALGFVAKAGAAPKSLDAFIWPAGINNLNQIGGIRVLSLTGGTNISLASAIIYNVDTGKLDLLAGVSNPNSLGLAIGQKGDVAGLTFNFSFLTFALTTLGSQWFPGPVPYDLPPATGINSAAFTTNDKGVAGGMSFTVNYSGGANLLTSFNFSDLRAVLWTGFAPQDIHPLTGAKFSGVQGINNNGVAVGFKGDAVPASGLSVLDFLVHPDNQNFRAFVYTNNKVFDLNTLVTNASGWTLTNATAINDSGQIVGGGFLNGKEHAFLLTPVTAPVTAVISAVSGAANSSPAVSSISPNGYFTLYGSNFAASTVLRALQGSDIVNNTLPTNMASTCVNAGNTRAFLSFVSAGQINALAPALTPGSSVNVSVVSNCGTGNEVTSPTVSVPVAAASPEFLYWVANKNAPSPVIAVDAVTGAYIGPPGLISGLTFRAAKSGDILTFYGISFGKTSSGGPVPGAVAAAADNVAGNVTLTIGGKPVTFSYAGITPSYGGLYQVNAAVPSGLTAGNNAVVLTINGTPTSQNGFLFASGQ